MMSVPTAAGMDAGGVEGGYSRAAMLAVADAATSLLTTSWAEVTSSKQQGTTTNGGIIIQPGGAATHGGTRRTQSVARDNGTAAADASGDASAAAKAFWHIMATTTPMCSHRGGGHHRGGGNNDDTEDDDMLLEHDDAADDDFEDTNSVSQPPTGRLQLSARSNLRSGAYTARGDNSARSHPSTMSLVMPLGGGPLLFEYVYAAAPAAASDEDYLTDGEEIQPPPRWLLNPACLRRGAWGGGGGVPRPSDGDVLASSAIDAAGIAELKRRFSHGSLPLTPAHAADDASTASGSDLSAVSVES